jgi:hypothetical protein
MARARGVATAVVAAVLAFAGTTAPVVAAGSGGAFDITASPLGQSLRSEALAQFANDGYFPANLRVWHDSYGYLVADPSATLLAAVTTSDAGQSVELLPATPGAPVDMAQGQQIDAAQYWYMRAQQCFYRVDDTWSWMDHCYEMYQLMNDGNGSHDYYALYHYTSVGPNYPWVINSAEIDAQAIGGTVQSWVDWNPRSDRTGNCVETTVSVSVFGVGISHPVEKCEEWDFVKTNPAVNYGLGWIGSGTRHNRELAFEIAVSVNQGAWPQWSLPGAPHGSPI